MGASGLTELLKRHIRVVSLLKKEIPGQEFSVVNFEDLKFWRKKTKNYVRGENTFWGIIFFLFSF